MAVNDDEAEGGSGREGGRGEGLSGRLHIRSSLNCSEDVSPLVNRGPTKRILTPTEEAVFADVVPVREVSECGLRKDVIVVMLQLSCRELQQKRKKKKKNNNCKAWFHVLISKYSPNWRVGLVQIRP